MAYPPGLLMRIVQYGPVLNSAGKPAKMIGQVSADTSVHYDPSDVDIMNDPLPVVSDATGVITFLWPRSDQPFMSDGMGNPILDFTSTFSFQFVDSSVPELADITFLTPNGSGPLVLQSDLSVTRTAGFVVSPPSENTAQRAEAAAAAAEAAASSVNPSNFVAIPGVHTDTLRQEWHLSGFGALVGNVAGLAQSAINAMAPGDTLLFPPGASLQFGSEVIIPDGKTGIVVDLNRCTITQTAQYTSIFSCLADEVTVRRGMLVGTQTGDEKDLATSTTAYGAGIVMKQVSGGLLEDIQTRNCGAPDIGASPRSGGGSLSGAGIWLTSSRGVTVRRHNDRGSFMALNTDDFYSATSADSNFSQTHTIENFDYANGVNGYVMDLQANTLSTGDRLIHGKVATMSRKGVMVDAVRGGASLLDIEVSSCVEEGVAILHESSGITLNDVRSHHNLTNLVLQQESGRTPANITIINFVSENATNSGIRLLGCNRVKFLGGRSRFNGGNGVYAVAATFNSNVEWHGFNSSLNVQNGYQIYDFINWSFYGGNIYGNSSAAPNTFDGIRTQYNSADPIGLTLFGTAFQSPDTATQTQNYGLNITHTQGSRMAISGVIPGIPAYGTRFLNDATGAIQIRGVAGFSDRIQGGLHIADVTTEPATPIGGSIVYSQAGSLKSKGSGGTVTVLGLP